MLDVRIGGLALLAALALPAAAQGQGGLLRRVKEKAAEKAAEAAARKAAEAVAKPGASDTAQRAAVAASGAARDSAASSGASSAPSSTPSSAAASEPPAAPRRSGGGGGMNVRRATPLDPTLLESPGYKPPAGQGAAPTSLQRDPALDREWHGTPQDLGRFAATIPTLTDAALDAYVRARDAQVAEAQRIRALLEHPHTRAWRDTVQAQQTRALAADEKVPYLQAEPWEKLTRSLGGVSGGDFERRLDAVAERELGGTLTRLQFYQVHEMVQKFLAPKSQSAGVGKAQGPGRDLTGAELAALERHRATLERLKAAARGL